MRKQGGLALVGLQCWDISACHSHLSNIMQNVENRGPRHLLNFNPAGNAEKKAWSNSMLCLPAPCLTAGRCSVLAVHSLQHSQPRCAGRLPPSFPGLLHPAPSAQLRPVRCWLLSAPCWLQELPLQTVPGQPALQGWDLPAQGASVPTAHRKHPARDREQAARHRHVVCAAVECTASSPVRRQALICWHAHGLVLPSCLHRRCFARSPAGSSSECQLLMSAF